MAVLAACPLAIAAVTPLEIRVIAAGLSPVVPAGLTMGALKSPWVLQPVFAGFSILSPSWLWIEMPGMLVLVALLTWAVSGRRLLRVRRVPAWRSATIGVEGADSYTAFGYANPTRRVLASVLHTRAEVGEIMMEDNGGDDGSGAPDGPTTARMRRRTCGTPPTWWRWWRAGCTGPRAASSPRSWRPRSACSPAAWTPTCCTC